MRKKWIRKQVHAVFDNVGPATWDHTMSSVARGGTVVSLGITTGPDVKMALLPIFASTNLPLPEL
jgi:NADPH:quinone reductase-like Zn-dependent oxidoreductase